MIHNPDFDDFDLLQRDTGAGGLPILRVPGASAGPSWGFLRAGRDGLGP